jgi:hypothetical protein
MWLPDYVLLLNHFGGRLISNEKVTLLSVPNISWEHFFLISTKHLRSRARVTTCFLNLFVEQLDCFSPAKILELLRKNSISVDPLVLVALAHKALTLLKSRPDDVALKIKDWETIIIHLKGRQTQKEGLVPLFVQLPFPRKLDPDFKAAGLAYTGFEYAPKKYLKISNS